MFKNIGLYLRTISHLKGTQILFRVKYIMRSVFPSYDLEDLNESQVEIVDFHFIRSKNLIGTNPYIFEFLNQSVNFSEKVDWNYARNGKLWTYNLNYFDFITNSDLRSDEVTELIGAYHDCYKSIKDGKDSYPTSLRIMNLIKIFGRFRSPELEYILICDIRRLYGSLEYHILGNHLLENAFALYFASHLYPENRRLTNKAVKLLREQLKEQILKDGGHYERSFMYHQIVLGRLLESISLTRSNPHEWSSKLMPLLVSSAESMVNWMSKISNNGEVFMRFNDSIEGISPSYNDLLGLAWRLFPIRKKNVVLDDSGFRVWRLGPFFFTLNIGEIGPKYQPGHAHADTLSFTLHYNGYPVIVDPGISTYESNDIRQLERSTFYHNTVSVNRLNNNEVWGSFRVGNRAKTNVIFESDEKIEVTHDGYKGQCVYHTRSWIKRDGNIVIRDRIKNRRNVILESCFHFAPNTSIKPLGESILYLNHQIILEFTGSIDIKLEDYFYCVGFNQTLKAKKAVVSFKKILETTIKM